MRCLLLCFSAFFLSGFLGCGASVDLCVGIVCGAAQLCDASAGACTASAKCDGVACGPGQLCDGSAGACVTGEKCAGVTCGSGQLCDGNSGACAAAPKCVGVTCPGGQICIGDTGACAAPGQCSGVTCSAGLACDAATGMCVSKCAGVTCQSSESCNPNTGTCINKCAGAICQSNESCDRNTGACINKCVSTTCQSNESCDSTVGACVNKCTLMPCSNGQICDSAVGACKNPPPPSLAAAQLIDRAGRPVINTVLTNPFGMYKPMGTAEAPDVTKNHYNADANLAMWGTAWSPAISVQLGLFDALDNVCGNQAGYGGGTHYSPVATLLAQDMLTVDTSRTQCTQYLAVELAALGMAITDCGGRKLDYDVIDTTYSVLTTGALSGMPDGIDQSLAPAQTFPFMLAPL